MFTGVGDVVKDNSIKVHFHDGEILANVREIVKGLDEELKMSDNKEIILNWNLKL